VVVVVVVVMDGGDVRDVEIWGCRVGEEPSVQITFDAEMGG
jgi:hypothetical protein